MLMQSRYCQFDS